MADEKSICPACKAEIDVRSKFCPKCGTKIMHKHFCSACGTEIQQNAKFCPKCGAAQIHETFSQPNEIASNENVFRETKKTLEQNDKKFNLWQKFFMLVVVLGYMMPIYGGYEYYIDSKTGEYKNYWTEGGGFEIVGLNEDIPYSLLLTVSVICAGLTLISAIAFKVSKNAVMKSLSTAMHFIGFISFVAWVIIRILNDLIWRAPLVWLLRRPGVYVMLAGYMIRSIRIPVGRK